MDDAISIRRAVLADASTIATLINAAYARFRATIPDLPDVAAGIEDDISNNHVRVLVDGTRIAGALVLVPGDGFLKLANVAVDPAYGGRGLGSRLISHAEAETKRLGFSEMRLNTHATMPQNVALYEKLGWEVTARDGNVVAMVKAV